MEEFDLSLDTRTKRIMKFLLYTFLTIFFITFVFLYLNAPNEKKQKLLNVERYTRVVEVYANKEQHNLGYVRFSNGINEFLEYPYKVGDSISKRSGDSIEYIFRKDNIIKNNLLEKARNDGLLK